MPAELFRATTLTPGMWQLEQPLVERPRLLAMLNRHPQTGAVTWMVGPLGAGKTTIGLQWANSLDTEVQYVSATTQQFSTDTRLQPPNEFGGALRDLLNLCARSDQDVSKAEVSEHLDHVIRFSRENRQTFILDDLQQIHRPNMNTLVELMATGLPQLQVDRALFISRTMDANVLGGLQSLPALRMILPDALTFDSEESAAAQKLGVFGTATHERVEAARIASHGWVSGMLVSLHGHGGRTWSPNFFRSTILNELLQDQPPPILQIMVASAHLPFNHREIWEPWFDRLKIPHFIIPSMAAQLPTSEAPSPPGRIDLSPVIRDALREIRSITLSDTELEDFLSTALDWYIENNQIEAAGNLAESHGLHDQLLYGLKQLYKPAAEVENWSEIRNGLQQIPEDILVEDPDLTYWYFHAVVEDDRWPVMKRLHGAVSEIWQHSDDPIVRGRAHLVNSWNAYMLNQADKAVESCALAYESFPDTLHRERMWAAGTASLANSLRGNRPEARRWSALANFEATFTPYPSRWWHNNASPLRYSWMCTVGLMSDAYAVAGQQIRSLKEDVPQQAMRYVLLRAQIELERMNLQSAELLVNKAGESLDEYYSQQHFYRIVRANIARARGEYETAESILTEIATPTRRRFDQFAREMFARAFIALDKGDLDSAEFLLNGVAPGERAWPKFFGDAHPDLIRSMLLHARGDVEEAISVAQATLKEAQQRNHLYYVVRAQSILAYIYHHSQQPELWKQAVHAATSAAGDSGYQLAFFVRTQDVRELGETAVDETQAAPIGVASNNIAHRLSTREVEVVSLAAQSISNKQIAEQMYISVSTVKNHLASVYDKLGTNNRRAAVRIARQYGVITN